MQKLIRAYIILLAISHLAIAQQEYDVNYTIEDGLPSNNVYCVEQDAQGFIWLGTDAGLSRFDGYEFKNFTLEDGLPDMEILKFFKDAKDRIWMYTLNGRVGYIQQGKIYNSGNVDFLEGADFNSRITHIAEIDEQIFINSITTGYRIIEAEGRSYFNGQSGLQLSYGISTKEAFYAVGIGFPRNGQNGFIQLDSLFIDDRMDSLKTQRLNFKSNMSGFAASYFVPIGHYVIGGSLRKEPWDVIMIVDFRKRLFYEKRIGKAIYNVIKYQNKLFMFHAAGVSELALDDFSSIEYLTLDYPSGLLFDTKQNLWVSTLKSGVLFYGSKEVRRIDKQRIQSVEALDVPESSSSLFMIHNDSMVGEFSQGLRLKFSISTSTKKTIEVDDDANIWTLSHRFLKRNGLRADYSEIQLSYSFLQDNSHLYYDFNDQLILRDLKLQKEIFLDGFELGRIRDFDFPSDSSLIVRTDFGVFFADLRSKAVDELETLSQLNVTQVAKDQFDILWLATNGNGLLRIKIDSLGGIINAGEFLNRQQASRVHSKILLLDSVAYLSSPKGIDKFSYNQNSVRYLYTLSAIDGLASGRINDLEFFNDSIYVGQDNGLFAFSHEESFQESSDFPVYLDKVLIGDSSYTFQEGISFLYNELPIQFICKAINYKNVGNLDYQFRLLAGAEEGVVWNSTSTNQILFSGLQPGEYTFQFRAKSRGSNWTQPINQKFEIVPQVWQTAWFRAIVIALVVGIVYWGWFLINAGRTRRKNLVRQKSISDLKALKAQINPHFLFNSLNAIQSFILEGSQEVAEDYLVTYGRLMRLILNHSNELTIPLSEELELIRLYVSLEKVRLGKELKFEMKIDPSMDLQDTKVPSMIIQPILENAIWHGIQPSQARGEILLGLQRKNEQAVTVTIQDNGVGFEVNALGTFKKPRGFKLVKERIELLDKIHRIKSHFHINSDQSGTRVEFVYPANLS